MLFTGGKDVSGLSGDEGTVGVGHKSGVSVASGVADGGYGESLSGKVSGLSGKDLGGLSGGNGAVGVGNKATGVNTVVGMVGIRVSSGVGSIGVSSGVGTVVGIGVSSGVGTVVGIGESSGIGGYGESLSGEMSGLSGDDLGGLGGGDGAVGVGHQLGCGGSSHDREENL